MLTLTLKNIPKQLHAQLKDSAERHRRSLNSEILARLESDFIVPTIDRDARTRLLRESVANFPKVDHTKVSRYKRQGRA